MKKKNNITIPEKPIGEETEEAIADAALYLDTERAIASIEDGMKPSYRRLIWSAMQFPKGELQPSVKVINGMSSYHPHSLQGCEPLLASMVRSGIMTGTGSFGTTSILGEVKPAASPRYTKTRLSDLYYGMLKPLMQCTKLVESPVGPLEPEKLFVVFPLCLRKDTKIRLTDGRNLEIEKISEEEKKGIEHFVYSCTPDGDFRVSKILKAWKTKEESNYLRITLDNGEIINSTKDHRFMLRSGEYVEAKELSIGDSLMPGYFLKDNPNKFHRESIRNNYTCDYPTLYELADKYNIEHGVYKFDPTKTVLHRIDKNKDNNSPTNIIRLSRKEHSRIYAKERKGIPLSKKTKEKIRKKNLANWAKPEFREKMLSIKEKWLNTEDGKAWKEENRERLIKYNKSDKGKENAKNYWNDKNRSKVGWINRLTALKKRNSDPDFQKFAKDQRNKWLKTEEGQKFTEKLKEDLKKRNSDPEFIIKATKAHTIADFKNLINKNKLSREDAYKKLENRILRWFGSKEKFEEEEKLYNHTITNIEEIKNDKQDFYDIEVDSQYHNFLLSAGVVVHNCLYFRSLVQGLGYGVSTIYPNFSPESLYQAMIHDDPKYLEANVDLILDKRNSELDKLWTTGKGRVIYSYKLSKYTSEDGKQGYLFEGDTCIFTPGLRKIKKYVDTGQVFIEDMTDKKGPKMFVGLVNNRGSLDIKGLEKLCRTCCYDATVYQLNVTDGKSVFRIPLRDWLHYTYDNYIKVLKDVNLVEIDKVKFQICVQQAIPEIANYLINTNIKASNKEIREKFGLSEEVVEAVMEKPISYLRANTENKTRITGLNKKLRELLKFDPVKYTEELISKL